MYYKLSITETEEGARDTPLPLPVEFSLNIIQILG